MFLGSSFRLVDAPLGFQWLNRGNWAGEVIFASPAGLPQLPLPGSANSTASLSPAGYLLSSGARGNWWRQCQYQCPWGFPPLPTLAIKKLVSFSVKAIDFFFPLPQANPTLCSFQGLRAVSFTNVSFRTFIYRIKEELPWVSCYLASSDLKYSWKMQGAL